MFPLSSIPRSTHLFSCNITIQSFLYSYIFLAIPLPIKSVQPPSTHRSIYPSFLPPIYPYSRLSIRTAYICGCSGASSATRLPVFRPYFQRVDDVDILVRCKPDQPKGQKRSSKNNLGNIKNVKNYGLFYFSSIFLHTWALRKATIR
jgi:hypothetical protein